MESCTRYRTEIGILAGILFLFGGYLYACTAPSDFVPGTIVRVATGALIPQVAQDLADARVISHPVFLRVLLRLSGASNKVQSGVYKFDTPQNIFTIAYRLVTGESGIPNVRITFVEGTTIREMTEKVTRAFPDITEEEFRVAAKGYEGYLFPDTYIFTPATNATSIVATLRANFDTKITPLQSDIILSKRSLSDIVILASLVEKEARTSMSRRMVAGILWNRLALGMPLQVDAVFGYIFDRDTYSPSFADLKVDSPYNTYTHTGLPPGPIDNPGFDSLDAAVYPTKTSYLYYLTGKDNLMHYATTYAGHQANQKKYLY